MTTIDDMLDDRMTGGSEFPEFWKPEDEGETIQGVVTDRQDNPWADEDDEDPSQILHVQTHNEEYSTCTHTALSNLIIQENVNIGDYVRVEFTGKETTDRGQEAFTYRLGVVKAEELEDSDIDVPETDGGMVVQKPEIPDDAIEFVENLIEYRGEMSEEEVDRYLNETRKLDVDVEDVIEQTSYELRNGVVR